MIQQLRYLLSVVDEESFSRAAEKSFTSRQNIAHSIKELERLLSVTLFERAGNRMVLTPEGKKTAEHANEIVTRVDKLLVLFTLDSATDTPLKIAISTNLFAGIPTDASSIFMEQQKEIKVFENNSEECFELVCSAKVDAAIIMSMNREFPDCRVLEIASSKSFALVHTSSTFAHKASISPEDLMGQKLMLMSGPDSQYKPLFEQLDFLGYDHGDISVIASTGSMLHLLKRGKRIGLISEKFASDPPPGTKAIYISDKKCDWYFYMIYKASSAKEERIIELAKMIQAQFKNDGGCGTAGTIERWVASA